MKEVKIGDTTLRFHEEAHKYEASTKDGFLPVPGVTTVCGMKNKPFLVPWGAKTCADWLQENWKKFLIIPGPDEDELALELCKEMKGAHKRIVTKAADSGTVAHEWIEKFIKMQVTEPVDIEDESALKAIWAFLKWWNSHEIKVIASEELVFSKDNWYAGTMDLMAEIDGVLTLADFKTSSNIYPDMAVQLGAYRLAYGEMGNPLPEEKLIINIQKNGSLQTAKFNDHEADEREFIALLAVYRISRDRPKPNIERIK